MIAAIISDKCSHCDVLGAENIIIIGDLVVKIYNLKIQGNIFVWIAN